MVHEQCMRPVNGKSRKMDSKKNKEEFVELLRSTGRDGVEDVITGLEELGFLQLLPLQGIISTLKVVWYFIPSIRVRLLWQYGKG